MVAAALAAGFVVAVLATGSARADSESLNPDAFDLSGALERPVARTGPGVEIALGGGYTQGVGGAGVVGSVEDLTGPGGGVDLELAYRISPRFSAGLYGTFARFRHGEANGDGSSAQGATAGVQALWHSAQASSIDPWISVGLGWRGLWLTRAGEQGSSMHGLELLRVQAGIDYRITPRLAIAPVVAMSLSIFLVENAVTPDDFTQVRDKRLNLFGFTGLLGRFDLGG